MQHILNAALELAASGLAVFPCSGSKAPATPHGHKDASADFDMVRALWRSHPGELIGVPTGATNGFDVLDIDRKHPEALAWLKANRPRLPETRVHRTRACGVHLVFRHHDLVKCSVAKLALGVDTRSDGGYIIHWPSAGLPVLCDALPAPWPSWLIEALQPKPEPPSRPLCGRIGGPGRLAALVRFVASAPEGSRNHATFWAACRAGEMVAAGVLAADMAKAVIAEAAMRAGLPRGEAERTARSGIQTTNR